MMPFNPVPCFPFLDGREQAAREGEHQGHEEYDGLLLRGQKGLTLNFLYRIYTDLFLDSSRVAKLLRVYIVIKN